MFSVDSVMLSSGKLLLCHDSIENVARDWCF